MGETRDGRRQQIPANGGRRKAPFPQGHAGHANRRRYFLLWCDPRCNIVILDVRVLIVKSGMSANLTLLPGMRIQTTKRAFSSTWQAGPIYCFSKFRGGLPVNVKPKLPFTGHNTHAIG
jgi:hypothetical protein